MKHLFRFIWWGALGGVTLACMAVFYIAMRFLIYPLWNFRAWRDAEHPDHIVLSDFRSFPAEIWQRMIGKYTEPKLK
jgi:hypothetical protein